MKVVFVTPRLPYPPLKGNSLRAYHQIRTLANSNEIALISFIEDEEQLKWIPELAKHCYRIETVLLTRLRSLFNVAIRAASEVPYQCIYFWSQEMQNKINEVIRAEKPEVVHVQLARMAQYFKEMNTVPKVLDLIDALSLNLSRRLEREDWLWKPAVYLEWRKFEKYERRACGIFDRVVVSSGVDKEWLGLGDNCSVVANGVDAEYFSYSPISNRQPRTIIFTGKMGYFPNVDAAVYFSRSIYPMVKAALPEVELQLVGADPSKKIIKLAQENPTIKVTGFVEDIRDYLGSATIAVCPMKSGSGIQNKALEALAMGTPVVASPQAVAALETVEDEHVLLAETPEEFSSQIVRLLKDPSLRERLSRAGRRLVEERYTWQTSADRLEEVYLGSIPSQEKNFSL